MTKLILAAALALLAVPAPAQDLTACRSGAPGPAALVTVHGFKDRAGRLRVQDYRGTPDEYLASGRYLQRAELPMPAAGEVTVCLTLPAPGRYAIVALHDRDSDGKLSIWGDGIGFSNDPRLGLSKPSADRTLVNFGAGVTPVRIVVNYRRGFSIRPIEAPPAAPPRASPKQQRP